MLNLIPLLSELTILDKNLRYKKLDLSSKDDFAWCQRQVVDSIHSQYNAGKPVRIIILKARQLGMSTLAEGILFNWAFLHPGTNGLVISHEQGHAQELLEKTKLYWDTWPFKPLFTEKYSTKNELTWIETRSKLKIATAKNVQSGRGLTVHAVHASEAAAYPDPRTLMTALNQGIPYHHGTIIIYESTARGSGNWWHEQWLMAKEGEIDYTPLFFPWMPHAEYKMKTTLSTKLELSPYERWLLTLGADYENIQWRRWKLRNEFGGDENNFMQEFPATDEEAFISTGQPIFPYDALKECFQPSTGIRGMLIKAPTGRIFFEPTASGNLTIFRKPNPDRPDRYFIAGDPSMTIEGDPACIQVINRQTLEQVAVWHGRIDPVTFATEMELLGYFFGSCMLCPEVEGGGQATVGALLANNYPSIWMHQVPDKSPGKVGLNYGWSTNFQRKSWAIGVLKKLIADRSICIHDQKTYNQLRDYVVRQDGTWGNSNDLLHDDAVMALSIAYTASQVEGVYVPEIEDTLDPIHRIWNQENMDSYEDMFGVMGA